MLQRLKCASFSLASLCLVAVNLSQAKTDIDKLLDSAVGVWLFDDGKGEVARTFPKKAMTVSWSKVQNGSKVSSAKPWNLTAKIIAFRPKKNYSITSKSLPFHAGSRPAK